MRALVDTSFWIDYSRGELSGEERGWIEALWQDHGCVLYQFVWLELLVGFRSREERNALRDYRAISQWKPIEEADATKAESFAHSLRKSGLTLSASDLLILAAADGAGAKLIHHDGDFKPVLALREFGHLRFDPESS